MRISVHLCQRKFLNKHLRFSIHDLHVFVHPPLVSKNYVPCFCHVRTFPVSLDSTISSLQKGFNHNFRNTHTHTDTHIHTHTHTHTHFFYLSTQRVFTPGMRLIKQTSMSTSGTVERLDWRLGVKQVGSIRMSSERVHCLRELGRLIQWDHDPTCVTTKRIANC
jgi:hypothetical protein